MYICGIYGYNYIFFKETHITSGRITVKIEMTLSAIWNVISYCTKDLIYIYIANNGILPRVKHFYCMHM